MLDDAEVTVKVAQDLWTTWEWMRMVLIIAAISDEEVVLPGLALNKPILSRQKCLNAPFWGQCVIYAWTRTLN